MHLYIKVAYNNANFGLNLAHFSNMAFFKFTILFLFIYLFIFLGGG